MATLIVRRSRDDDATHEKARPIKKNNRLIMILRQNCKIKTPSDFRLFFSSAEKGCVVTSAAVELRHAATWRRKMIAADASRGRSEQRRPRSCPTCSHF